MEASAGTYAAMCLRGEALPVDEEILAALSFFAGWFLSVSKNVAVGRDTGGSQWTTLSRSSLTSGFGHINGRGDDFGPSSYGG